MAQSPARFTFDLDLGSRKEAATVVTQSALAASVAEARRLGFAEGFAEAEQSQQAASARQLATAAGMLADRVGAMAAELDDSRRATLADAVDLAASI
jgi:flagellar biosynthesis/type III secretory pathway protein FliH